MILLYIGCLILGILLAIGADNIHKNARIFGRAYKLRTILWVLAVLICLAIVIDKNAELAQEKTYKDYDSGKIHKEYRIDDTGCIIDSVYVYRE